MNISIQWPGNLPKAPRAPSSKFASVPYPPQILHRPQLLKDQGHNLPQAAQNVDSVYGCIPRPRKAKPEANLQMVGSCKHFLWGMSNKAFLSVSIKKLPKECAVTSFGQQRELQKVGFNRLGYMVGLGQVRLSKLPIFCDRASAEELSMRWTGALYGCVVLSSNAACIPHLCLLP